MYVSLLVVTCFVSVVVVYNAYAQEIRPEPINVEDASTRDSVQIDRNEQLFKKLFARRRSEHLQAVRDLRKMENYEKQYKMIKVLAEKAFLVIQTSRGILESADFEPGNDSFPEDINLRDALSNILENTALFGDIILHLPDISHRMLKTQQQWNTTMRWAVEFSNRTKHLLDKSTITMIHLVSQELNITAREPEYFNPYWRKTASDNTDEGDSTKSKKKAVKKEKRKRGPRMTKTEL